VGGRELSISVDLSGRLTVVAHDASVLTGWVGGQGAIGPSGTFYAQSEDGQVQFEGSVGVAAAAITCAVKSGGSTLFTVDAAMQAAGGATPLALVGSYAAAGTQTAACLTVGTDGHAALWVRSGATNGGDALSVSADGKMASSDGGTAAVLDVSSGSPVLTITKLNGTPASIVVTLERVTKAKWTFMVYINAANDLQQFGPLNVNQMEKIGSTSDVNVVVQWKQANCASCGSPDWVATRRYFITRDQNTGQIGSQLVEDMGTGVDMGDWRELYDFIHWAQQRYPADRYALVIWNHGAGWRNTRAGSAAAVRSVSIDDSTGSEIQTWQLPQALNVSPKLDLLVFDASLMQMTEVAYEVRSSASIMVGSEESPPGEGYVYDTFLGDLTADPGLTPVQLAAKIVERTIESYGASSNITQSALDLSRLQTVADRLDSFGRSLQFYSTTYGAQLLAARQGAESYQYHDNKDLWHYAEKVRTGGVPADLQTAASNLQQAVTSAVISERHGSLHPNSHGLAIYVPAAASYLLTYNNLALTRVTQWDEWLRSQPSG